MRGWGWIQSGRLAMGPGAGIQSSDWSDWSVVQYLGGLCRAPYTCIQYVSRMSHQVHGQAAIYGGCGFHLSVVQCPTVCTVSAVRGSVVSPSRAAPSCAVRSASRSASGQNREVPIAMEYVSTSMKYWNTLVGTRNTYSEIQYSIHSTVCSTVELQTYYRLGVPMAMHYALWRLVSSVYTTLKILYTDTLHTLHIPVRCAHRTDSDPDYTLHTSSLQLAVSTHTTPHPQYSLGRAANN